MPTSCGILWWCPCKHETSHSQPGRCKPCNGPPPHRKWMPLWTILRCIWECRRGRRGQDMPRAQPGVCRGRQARGRAGGRAVGNLWCGSRAVAPLCGKRVCWRRILA